MVVAEYWLGYSMELVLVVRSDVAVVLVAQMALDDWASQSA